MNNSTNVVNKAVLIKRAKRRLLGAFTILILIIILSYFFVWFTIFFNIVKW